MSRDAPVQVYAKTLVHPLRERVLREMDDGTVRLSPKMLADRTGVALGVVSYHVRALARLRAIRAVKKVPRRGAVEHFYAITAIGRSALLLADTAQELARQNNL